MFFQVTTGIILLTESFFFLNYIPSPTYVTYVIVIPTSGGI